MDRKEHGGIFESTVNKAALLVKERVNATAVSIYERWRDEDRFYLTGCVGWEPGVPGPASELKRPDLSADGTWIGLTSYVAFHKTVLRIARSRDGVDAIMEDRPVSLTMDTGSCEIASPGPFLGVPILDGSESIGVIRAVRSENHEPFAPEDEARLRWVARFLALSFIQERMRADLIEGLMSIASCDDESEALERIAAEAKRLLNYPSAVFLRQPGDTGRYMFRAPAKIAAGFAQMEYAAQSGGYTPLVLFKGRPYVVSPNLLVDSAPGGPLFKVGHEPKAAEVGPAEAASLVAVPIPGFEHDQDRAPRGAIRASSEIPYAFSHRDVETLSALARQASVVLKKLKDARDREILFETIVDTSNRPIVAIDNHARLTACNDAAAELLGLVKEEAIGMPLLEAAYARNRKLAQANGLALKSANGTLRNHYTTVYRKCPQGWLTIPVRVDASYLHASTGEVIGAVAYLDDLRGPDCASDVAVIEIVDEDKKTFSFRTVDRDTVGEIDRLQRQLDGHIDSPILISGETGVGKELLAAAAAKALERPSCRRINCAGLEDSILESEMFGVAKEGMATDLHKHWGLFDPNFTGTVVLDEIQELSAKVQAKLLRVLDSGKVRPIGGNEIDLEGRIRVVALTNADLDAMERENRFRTDLKHRLRGITFHIKPLRERRADIMQLADHFLAKARTERKDLNGPEGFDSGTIRALLSYQWPGNVRELEKTITHALTRSVATNPNMRLIPMSALPEWIQTAVTHVGVTEMIRTGDDNVRNRLTALDDIVASIDERVSQLERTKTNVPFSKVFKDYSKVFKEALDEDPQLKDRFRIGGVDAVNDLFRARGFPPPGRSTAYELLKEAGISKKPDHRGGSPSKA